MDDEAGSSLTRTNEASRSEAMLEVIIGVLQLVNGGMNG